MRFLCLAPLVVSENVLNRTKYRFFDQDKFICVISKTAQPNTDKTLIRGKYKVHKPYHICINIADIKDYQFLYVWECYLSF